MKYLLTGVAMAAALAIAAPVWAQNASTPGGNNPTSGSAGPLAPKPAAPAPAAAPAAAPEKPMAAKPMTAKKPMRHHMATMRRHGRRHAMNAGDSMTEQLNQQELQRITGGGAAAPAPMSPGGNNPTSGTAGPFAPAGSAPPPPAQK